MELLRWGVLLACTVALVKSHSAGAPKAACNSMTPDHTPNPTNIKGAQAPYILTAPEQIQAGQQTTIRISGGRFLGFMVRVLDKNGNSGGRFGTGNNFQAMECQTPDDTATHKKQGPNGYNSVELPWQAPFQPGVYRIMATIVQRYDLFNTGYYTDITVV